MKQSIGYLWSTVPTAIFEDFTKDTGGLGRRSCPLMIERCWHNVMLTEYRQNLPEAFLWEVFYYQAEAAAAMVNGPTNGHWEFDEIVHRDIKPGNGISNPLVVTQYHPLPR